MTTQTQVDNFSDQVIESVKSGEANSLEILVQLKAFEKASERILKEIKDNLLTEAGKHPGDKFEFAGAEITKADTFTKYDYSACGDPQWQRFNHEAEAATKWLKEREAFLKAVKAPFSLLDEGTGEVSQILPPKVTRIQGLKVSIK